MANSKSKLLATQNPFSVFLMICILFFLLITSVRSESFSFNFPSFELGTRSIVVDGSASLSGGAIQLTPKDQAGKPLQHSVGLAGFLGAVHLYDKSRGKVADFSTEFTFVVNPKGSRPHGDGLTFFIASLGFEFPDDNSSGGFLGLFNDETAFNTSKNQIVAVEFDSFANEWDPNFPVPDSPHIGIDINSIRSVATVPWLINLQPEGAIAKARISYDSYSKRLSVFVTYPQSPAYGNSTISQTIDFTTLLSERVLIGFSGTTGDLVETHNILSWSFKSFL